MVGGGGMGYGGVIRGCGLWGGESDFSFTPCTGAAADGDKWSPCCSHSRTSGCMWHVA